MCRRVRPIALQQHRNQRTFGFLHESHLSVAVEIDSDEITQLHLSGGHQIRQRKYDVALDGPLQVTRPYSNRCLP